MDGVYFIYLRFLVAHLVPSVYYVFNKYLWMNEWVNEWMHEYVFCATWYVEFRIKPRIQRPEFLLLMHNLVVLHSKTKVYNRFLQVHIYLLLETKIAHQIFLVLQLIFEKQKVVTYPKLPNIFFPSLELLHIIL
jgi:hypothetical protein